MKETHPRIALGKVCCLFGISRQAHYEYSSSLTASINEHSVVLPIITSIRSLHPSIGGRKLFAMIGPELDALGIQWGRDKLFTFLRNNGLLQRKHRNKTITTNSKHPYRLYPNLIKETIPTAPYQQWVSDITYVRTQQGAVFLSLITDAYSRKIVGYDLAGNLEAINTIKALKMAIREANAPLDGLTHHSDRGSQYCCYDYTGLLNQHNIQISMTQNGDPLENAIAERNNGIIKNEYLLHQPIRNKQHAIELVKKAIRLYNYHRPHLSLGLKTPADIHEGKCLPKRMWKNYYYKRPTIVNQNQD